MNGDFTGYRIKIDRWHEGQRCDSVDAADDEEHFGIAVGKCVTHHLLDDGSVELPLPLMVLRDIARMMAEGQQFQNGLLRVLHDMLDAYEEANSESDQEWPSFITAMECGLQMARAKEAEQGPERRTG